MPESEITIGELARRIDGMVRGIEAMERRFDARFTVIDRRLESLQFVTADRYEAEQHAIRGEILEIKDTVRWVSRAVAGAIITLVASAVLMLLTARGGL
jgi:hypothetical protein